MRLRSKHLEIGPLCDEQAEINSSDEQSSAKRVPTVKRYGSMPAVKIQRSGFRKFESPELRMRPI